MSIVLETQGLRKEYGKVVALHGLDLKVNKGEVFGFLGPNGAGKTTFTKCITGFVRPTAGEVRILDIDAVRKAPEAAHHIGLVPDQYDFYPNLSGRQHLDFYGRLLGLGPSERKSRIAEVLATVRMEERADSRTKTYSHGMKQRICIAQAILHEPQLILFDEPTNGLDPQGAYELRELIRGLAKDGTTVFLNSHLLTEVEQTCERVAIMHKGQLKALAPVKELQARGSKTGSQVEVQLLNPTKKIVTALAKDYQDVELRADSVIFRADRSQTPDAVTTIVGAGGKIVGVKATGATLESAFLELVGGNQ
jgi:ABC-2 type transport system ATP-binding protein